MTDLFGDTVERVDIGSPTHQTFEENDHEDDPYVRNVIVEDLTRQEGQVDELQLKIRKLGQVHDDDNDDDDDNNNNNINNNNNNQNNNDNNYNNELKASKSRRIIFKGHVSWF